MKVKRLVLMGLVAIVFAWAVFLSTSVRQIGSSLNGIRAVDVSVDRDFVESIPRSDNEDFDASPAATDSPALDIEPVASNVESQSDFSPVERRQPFRPMSTRGGPGWGPVSLLGRCFAMRDYGIFVNRNATWEIGREGVTDHYAAMPDEQLKVLADSGDGAAQLIYAYDRLLDLRSNAVNELAVSQEKVLARFNSTEDDLFVAGKQYFIDAFRNRNWIGANRLAGMYYPFDRVEAMAWLLIEQEAGGRTLGRRETQRAYADSTDEEKDASVIRALELIDEYDLSTAFPWPSECRDTFAFYGITEPERRLPVSKE